MNVSAMQEFSPLKLSWEAQKEESKGAMIPFGEVFQSAIQNVAQNEKTLEESQYMLSVGEIDDAHTVPIAAANAQLSVDLMVQLRNKAVEAFNELMRISL